MAEIPKLHPRSITFIFICIVGVTAMALLGLLPNHLELQDLRAEADQLRAEIERQEMLAPVVKKLVQKAKPLDLQGLETPPVRTPSDETIGELNARLADMAAQHGLTLEMAAPDERSLADTNGHLVLNLRVSGDFFLFRGFLLTLARQPELARMETLHIETLNDRRELSTRLVFLQAT
jgi:Tfp pilus assembly protein PilO